MNLLEVGGGGGATPFLLLINMIQKICSHEFDAYNALPKAGRVLQKIVTPNDIWVVEFFELPILIELKNKKDMSDLAYVMYEYMRWNVIQTGLFSEFE